MRFTERVNRLLRDIRQRGLGRAQSILYGWGVAVERARHPLAMVLENLEISHVIDGGANVGQFATGLRHAGYRGPVLSVEPGQQAHQKLASAAAADPSWTTLKAALGDALGALELHLSADSVSSSLLRRNHELVDTFSRSTQEASEKVPVTTLDQLVSDHGLDVGTTALKLDLQGYEAVALKGAKASLGLFPVVQLEMGFVATYEEQVLFEQLHATMLAHGYSLWNIIPAWLDRNTARLYWCDGIYVRSDLVASLDRLKAN